MRRLQLLTLLGLLIPIPAAAQDTLFLATHSGRTILQVLANGNVGISTGAPDRRLVVDSGGVAFNGRDGFVARGEYGQGTLPAAGIGPRMMWYPRKAAFRAGYALGSMWEDINIGEYSVALGSGSAASGQASAALTSGSNASGINATAVGPNASASGQNSLALGTAVSAEAMHAVAIGHFAEATADRAIAIGSGVTASGTYSTAMGRYASTNGYSGSFVYGDQSSITDMIATGANQFMVRAVGGTTFYSSSAGAQATWTGVRLNAGSGSWSALSDVNRKQGFRAVAGEELLTRLRRLPISTWNYRTQAPSVRHLGPTAQDFRAAFGLGEDSVTISSVDADGVALAAAQALEARTARLAAENQELRQCMDALAGDHAVLHRALAELLRRLEQMAPRLPEVR